MLRVEIRLSIRGLEDHYREILKAVRPLKRKMQSKQIYKSVFDDTAMSGSTSSLSCSADKLRMV